MSPKLNMEPEAAESMIFKFISKFSPFSDSVMVRSLLVMVDLHRMSTWSAKKNGGEVRIQVSKKEEERHNR